MTNDQMFARDLALINRKELFGFPDRLSDREAIAILLNKYILKTAIVYAGTQLLTSQATELQNIFSSISYPN